MACPYANRPREDPVPAPTCGPAYTVVGTMHDPAHAEVERTSGPARAVVATTPVPAHAEVGTVTSEGFDGDLEPIDWEAETGRRLPVRLQTVGFLLTAGLVVAAALYERFFVIHGHVPPWGWSPGAIGYMLYLSLAVVVFYLIVPLARRPKLTKRYWRRLRRKPAAMASLAYLVFFVLLGTVGKNVANAFGIGRDPTNPYGPPLANPPVGYTIDMWETRLVPICAGDVKDGVCHGSWTHPLGTTYGIGGGKDMVHATIEGARLALEIAFVTAAIIVVLGTLVGTVAALYGGWVDEVLMRWVDVQQVVPAIFVVIVLQMSFQRRIFTIVAVFGLLAWGGVARLVRSEALQRTEEAYVMAARSAGASRFTIVRRHVIPNVSNTIVTAATAQMPLLIVVEASIAFLGFSDPLSLSWGTLIADGLGRFPTLWWQAIVPAVLLIVTALSLNVLGDELRDVLDPRMEGRR